MSRLETQLAENRAVRDAARTVFDARLGQVRRSLGERSVPQRLADEGRNRALAVAEEGLAVAREGKWVLAATALALGAWLLRRPLIDSARALFGRLFDKEPASPWTRWRNWIKRKVTP